MSGPAPSAPSPADVSRAAASPTAPALPAGARRTSRLTLAGLLLAGLALLTLQAAVARHVAGFAVDDVFITYRYAENLAAGRGLVFNPGERVFGTTAPGHALALGAVRAATGAPIPRVGTLLTLAALATIAWLLLLAGRDRGRAPEGFLAGALVSASLFLWLHNGSEVFAALALLLAAARLAERRPLLAGLLAGYAAWCRADAVVGVGLLGLLLWSERRRLPWRYGAAAAATLAAGAAAAYAWFGRVLPGTLAAKRLQAEWLPEVWPAGGRFWPAALGYLGEYGVGTALVPLALVGAAGLAVLAVHGGRVGRLLALHAVALAVAYPLLGVAMYPWYVIPCVVAWLAGTAFAAGALARRTSAFFGRTAAARVLAAAAAAALVAPVAAVTAERAWAAIHAPPTVGGTAIYRVAGRWLAQHAAPGEPVAALEVGTLGFFSGGAVHDLLGLVSPAALPHVAGGDLPGAFLAGDPAWFVHYSPHAGLLDAIRDAPWFAAAFRPAARFEAPSGVLILYRRRPGATLPPP